MSKLLGEFPNTEFALGEIISFDHEGDRLTGEVVRVYASRTVYHVEVDGKRYEVLVPDDNPRKAYVVGKRDANG